MIIVDNNNRQQIIVLSKIPIMNSNSKKLPIQKGAILRSEIDDMKMNYCQKISREMVNVEKDVDQQRLDELVGKLNDYRDCIAF